MKIFGDIDLSSYEGLYASEAIVRYDEFIIASDHAGKILVYSFKHNKSLVFKGVDGS